MGSESKYTMKKAQKEEAFISTLNYDKNQFGPYSE
jgi:hypothetical protein